MIHSAFASIDINGWIGLASACFTAGCLILMVRESRTARKAATIHREQMEALLLNTKPPQVVDLGFQPTPRPAFPDPKPSDTAATLRFLDSGAPLSSLLKGARKPS